MMKKLLAVLAMVVMLSGCAAFNKLVTNNMLVSQLAVEAATAHVILAHPDWKAKTISITDSAIVAIDSKATAQLSDVETFIRSRISIRRTKWC